MVAVKLIRIETGFTFIEITIVILIMSILMMIALPSYTQHLNKGRRVEAMSALMDASNRQEQFMLDRNSYSSTLQNIGISPTTVDGNYSLAISTATAACPISSCYELTATVITTASQSNDSNCTKFILSSTGRKTAEGLNPNACW